ncbi:ArsR/SmtB family transcription factor [Amycolatopsis viridis]|uniref:DNA-binding transcriptional ArsR family regulator n=1 Tax=Amycolatopsis viridis TaxID=185678 RepID=A0ABX0SXV4_9PSEU|nr:helix-turn-helix domain-containing protein [Amycolatopsis viridis]NIH80365.1 DNA-binding transcriptional ArsR family regulator [Amycolatopsis viridis]
MSRTLPEPSIDSLDLTVILSALADPSRRALLTAMYRAPEPVDCAVLVEQTGLGLSNPTISHHYRILREAGLTRTVVEGRKRVVRVRREDLERRFPGLLEAILNAPDRTAISAN